MANETTDHFGRVLMAQVRDKVLKQTSEIVAGTDKSRHSERYRTYFAQATPEQRELVREMLVYQTDVVLSFVLGMLEDRDDLRMLVSTQSGVAALAEASDGLDGELWGPNGWIARFSEHATPLV